MAGELRYEPIKQLATDQLRADFESTDEKIVAEALYSAVRYEENWEWVQDVCLEKLGASNLGIRWAAATCLGDLAFLRRPLDLSRVIPALKLAIEDPTISDPASFSLSMVRQYLMAS